MCVGCITIFSFLVLVRTCRHVYMYISLPRFSGFRLPLQCSTIVLQPRRTRFAHTRTGVYNSGLGLVMIRAHIEWRCDADVDRGGKPDVHARFYYDVIKRIILACKTLSERLLLLPATHYCS